MRFSGWKGWTSQDVAIQNRLDEKRAFEAHAMSQTRRILALERANWEKFWEIYGLKKDKAELYKKLEEARQDIQAGK